MSKDNVPETTAGGGGGGGGEFMLFGVRVVVDSMRKSVSLNNLSQYDHLVDVSPDADVVALNIISAGYTSADDAFPRSSTPSPSPAAAVNRERKRGVAWTEEEHKLFLIGLQKVGKGDWRGISRNYVKTRTPTQVASHAQKYFLRRSNLNRRRRRSSLFDITTDSVIISSNHPPQQQQQQQQHDLPAAAAAAGSSSNSGSHQSMVNFDLNSNTSVFAFDLAPVSLNLTLSMSMSMSTEAGATAAKAGTMSRRNSTAFPLMQGFGNGDGVISVS
ncbi:hypothetical protein vseg_003094 [Gypsophila vaccaria]